MHSVNHNVINTSYIYSISHVKNVQVNNYDKISIIFENFMMTNLGRRNSQQEISFKIFFDDDVLKYPFGQKGGKKQLLVQDLKEELALQLKISSDNIFIKTMDNFILADSIDLVEYLYPFGNFEVKKVK